jgi:hypothetical protein
MECRCKSCHRPAKPYENIERFALWWCFECKVEIQSRCWNDREPAASTHGHPGISLMRHPRCDSGNEGFDRAIRAIEDQS